MARGPTIPADEKYYASGNVSALRVDQHQSKHFAPKPRRQRSADGVLVKYDRPAQVEVKDVRTGLGLILDHLKTNVSGVVALCPAGLVQNLRLQLEMAVGRGKVDRGRLKDVTFAPATTAPTLPPITRPVLPLPQQELKPDISGDDNAYLQAILAAEEPVEEPAPKAKPQKRESVTIAPEDIGEIPANLWDDAGD